MATGTALKLQHRVSGDIQLKSENWGCENRCDVDLGSSHNGGWRQSFSDWSDEGVVLIPFFVFLDSVGVTKQQPKSKYHNFNERHPSGEITKY